MACDELRNDQLLPPLAEEVRRHLDSCAECRERQDEIAALASALGELGRATPAPRRPALVASILAATSGRAPRRLPWIAAAALFLVVVGLATLRSPEAPVAAPPEPPRRPTARRPVFEPIPNLPLPPAPAPAPAPASVLPAPTRPAVPAAVLARVEGSLEIEREQDWVKVEPGLPWTPDRPLRGGSRPARFALPDGTVVVLARSAVVRLVSAAPLELALDKGAAAFEVVPGTPLAVATADARLRVTGTRFTVRVGAHTELVVSSGEVIAANDKGSVAVPAGAAVALRRASAPPPPRAVDADALGAWTRELDPPERVRVRYDFEDGRREAPWTSGKVVPGPARGLNRGCLEGTPNVDADLNRVPRKVPVLDAELEVRFRYWTADAAQITVQLSNVRVNDNHRFEVRRLAHGKWEQVRIPLSSFFRLADGTRPRPGDRYTWFNLSVSGASGPVYFDDVEIVEILR